MEYETVKSKVQAIKEQLDSLTGEFQQQGVEFLNAAYKEAEEIVAKMAEVHKKQGGNLKYSSEADGGRGLQADFWWGDWNNNKWIDSADPASKVEMEQLRLHLTEILQLISFIGYTLRINIEVSLTGELDSEYDDGGYLRALYGECSDWQSSSFNC